MQSSTKNFNRAFREKAVGKFLNLDFNGQPPNKIKNRAFGRQVASQIIFLKRVTDGKNIITGRSRMGNWLYSFQLFDHRQRDYLKPNIGKTHQTTKPNQNIGRIFSILTS